MWTVLAVVLGAALFVVVRSCGYDAGAVAIYAAYFAGYVVLPGVVTLRAVTGRPLSLTLAIALGVPTGFALEIATFLGLSAVGAKAWLPLVPVFWIAVAIAQRRITHTWPVRWRVTRRHAGVALGLGALLLVMVLAAVCQMFAESPLVEGLPQRPIFHDWVYLVSRAAAIKQHWPLEDPSLAGAELQYHYFMMVHAASASWVTKLELTLVMLRLMIVPLGVVLVVQAFALGRLLSRSAWGGVVAALLFVGASEVSFSPSYGQPMFLGLFMRWLFVSPTFFFGMIFFGALLLAVARGDLARRWSGRDGALLAVLAAAGAGAKGTVLPALLLALALLGVWRWWREGMFPARLAAIALVMGGAFAAVYELTMSSWGAGDATLEPYQVFHVTQFWQQHADAWVLAVKTPLKKWLHLPHVGIWLAELACAAVVIAGTSGVRLFAIPYLLRGDPRHRRRVGAWLGAAFIASCAMGTIIHMDSNGELYLILLIRLPLAVLSGAFMVSAAGRLWRWWGQRTGTAPGPTGVTIDPFGRPAPSGPPRPAWPARALAGAAVAATIVTFAVQAWASAVRNRAGFVDWLHASPEITINDDLVPLYDAMFWLRQHTEPNAVLIANAFTGRNMRVGRGVLVDHTTAGVHYYYSALSERRLWLEGPSYQLDVRRMRRRMALAGKIFYGGLPPSASMLSAAPCYAVIDHSIGDGAKIALPAEARVYANDRFEIFRVPPRMRAPMPQQFMGTPAQE